MQPNFTHHRQKQAIAGGIPRQSAEDKRHCTGGINPSGQGTTSTSRREKFYVSASKVYSKVLFIYSEVLFLLYSPRHRTFLGVVWNFMHRDARFSLRLCRPGGRRRTAECRTWMAQPRRRQGLGCGTSDAGWLAGVEKSGGSRRWPPPQRWVCRPPITRR